MGYDWPCYEGFSVLLQRKETMSQHIEQKELPFCRQHFEMHFVHKKYCSMIKMSLKFVLVGLWQLWALSYYSDLTSSQEFQPMAAQLSMKAALPFAKILASVSCRSSKTGPWFRKCRADFKFAPSQWEMALLCNDISNWPGTSLKSALTFRVRLSNGQVTRH